jgi:uncharacterized membrane protein YidH (DUF202 family)
MTRPWSRTALRYILIGIALGALEFGLVLIGVRGLGRELTSIDWLVIGGMIWAPIVAALLFILIEKMRWAHRSRRRKRTLYEISPTPITSDSMWDRDLDV